MEKKDNSFCREKKDISERTEKEKKKKGNNCIRKLQETIADPGYNAEE